MSKGVENGGVGGEKSGEDEGDVEEEEVSKAISCFDWLTFSPVRLKYIFFNFSHNNILFGQDDISEFFLSTYNCCARILQCGDHVRRRLCHSSVVRRNRRRALV